MSLFDGDSETLGTNPIKNSRSCDLPITKIRHFCNGRNEEKKNQIKSIGNVRSGSPVSRAEGSRIERASIPDRMDLFGGWQRGDRDPVSRTNFNQNSRVTF